MVEELWEAAGTKLGQSQQPEHRARLGSRVLFSDGWGQTHCIPRSHLIMDLMLGMDPGALPEADWDVLSKASLRGSIPGSRAAASLQLPRQIRGTRLIFMACSKQVSLEATTKGSSADLISSCKDLGGNAHRKTLHLVNLSPLSARRFRSYRQEKQSSSFNEALRRKAVESFPPFPIILVKYTAWKSTQAQRAVNLGLVIKSSLPV